MFVRVKKIKPHGCLCLVAKVREGGRNVQRGIRARNRRMLIHNSNLLERRIASATRHFRCAIVLSRFHRRRYALVHTALGRTTDPLCRGLEVTLPRFFQERL